MKLETNVIALKKTIGIAGWSGSGKTTLVENLIKVFKNKYKLKVCTIKHAHKNFEIDKKGKDSYRFSKAGSDQVIISSSRQWAVINQSNNGEKDLNFLLKNAISADIILVEGWKYSNIKKIEVYRKEVNKEFLYKNDNNIVAIALENTNTKIHKDIFKLDLNNYSSIADFIIKNNFEINNDQY